MQQQQSNRGIAIQIAIQLACGSNHAAPQEARGVRSFKRFRISDGRVQCGIEDAREAPHARACEGGRDDY
jgi:hypothetical protein